MATLVELLCYGIAQGTKAKIANRLKEGFNPDDFPSEDRDFLVSQGVGTVGEHIEAMRVTMVRIVKRLPEDQQKELIGALKDMGIELDTETNEAQKP